jgi:hypothetical protein
LPCKEVGFTTGRAQNEGTKTGVANSRFGWDCKLAIENFQFSIKAVVEQKVHAALRPALACSTKALLDCLRKAIAWLRLTPGKPVRA